MPSNIKRIKKAQKGDEEAFIELIKNDELRLYNTAIKILGNEYDAADVLQETVFAAYQNIEKLRNPKYFYTWLYRILINQCNKLIHSKNETYPLIDATQIDIDKHEPFQSIEYLVEHLNETYKIPILLFYQNGFSIKEISEILNEPEGTIKSKLSRGRLLIKKEFESDKEEISNENI